jgi:hypothetical protein
MFERFTDKARSVVILAKGKATERGDDEIRPVHMLYGLITTDGVAARALAGLALTPRASSGSSSAPHRRATCSKARQPAATPRRWRRSASTSTRSSERSRRPSVRVRSSAFR